MTLTVHDDAVGERALVAGSGISITGSTLSAAVGQITLAPAEFADRPFHYVVPVPLAGGTLQQISMNANFQGGTAFQGLTGADLRNASNRSLSTRNNIANSNCGGPYSAGLPQLIRGSLARVGGFTMVGRFAYPFFPSDGVFFFGASPVLRSGGASASGANNTICIGADTGDTNLAIITRDNAGGINKSNAFMSKADLTVGDPNTNGACVLDFGITWLPNASSATFWVWDASNQIYRLNPTPISANLPTNTALHISGAASTVGNVGRLDQEFIHFYGWW